MKPLFYKKKSQGGHPKFGLYFVKFPLISEYFCPYDLPPIVNGFSNFPKSKYHNFTSTV